MVQGLQVGKIENYEENQDIQQGEKIKQGFEGFQQVPVHICSTSSFNGEG
jgi:hypothetical protein